MKTIKFTLTILIALVFLTNKINAQEKTGTPLIDKFSISANFGSLLTYGDIKNYNFYPLKEERKWGFGGVVNYQISPIASIQIQGLTGKLAGVKRNFSSGNPANLKFDAELYEGSLNATISLNRWWAPNLKLNNKLNFYAMAGIGLVNFRTQLKNFKTDKLIKEYGWDNTGTVKEKMTTETTFPVGFGIKYNATKKLDIILETQLRNVYSDKLDAYVRPYNSQDKYGYTFVGISYKLGKQEKHMEWTSPKDLDEAGDKLALDEANKKIEELNKKMAELEKKQGTPVGMDDPRFAELNQRIDDLSKKVNELEGKAPVTNTSEGGNVDAQRLNELNQKLAELDAKNNELSNRIINMSTTNVTYEGGKSILVSVFFEVNKSTIDKANGERVAAAARYMKTDPNARIELIGHADKTGGQKYNELLSERRAKAVQQSLINEYGIDSNRISISFKGFTDPLSQQNYDVNRRVDFIVK